MEKKKPKKLLKERNRSRSNRTELLRGASKPRTKSRDKAGGSALLANRFELPITDRNLIKIRALRRGTERDSGNAQADRQTPSSILNKSSALTSRPISFAEILIFNNSVRLHSTLIY